MHISTYRCLFCTLTRRNCHELPKLDINLNPGFGSYASRVTAVFNVHRGEG